MTALKRKVANPLALAVLVLLYERPMHPYEMAATLRERRKEESIKLRYGSLYTVIELLVRAGFITEKKTMRQGNRPERTVYAISKAGEAEMRSWMRELLSTPSKEYPQFEAGLSLLPALPPHEVTDVLETAAADSVSEVAKISRNFQQAVYEDAEAFFTGLDKLASAKSINEAVQIQSDLARARGEAFISRAKSSTEYFGKLVANGAKAAQDNFTKVYTKTA